MEWTNPERAGLLPLIINPHDTRSVKEQIEVNYAHGGGYFAMHGFKLHDHKKVGQAFMTYPGDPKFHEVARCRVGDELVILFDCAFVAIVDSKGRFTVTRMD